MKVYLTLYMFFAGFASLFGQDTITVNLDVRDTTYFDRYVQIKGTSYQFQNKLDSAYLEIEPNVQWTLFRRNQSESYPQYRFKPNMPDGVYKIYQESLLVEVVQFKNHKRVGKSLQFKYEVVDKDRRWMKDRTSKIGYHGACDKKENIFKLVVYKTAITYYNGEVKQSKRSVYLRKRKLCKYRYNREKKKTVPYLIYRGFKKRYSEQRKVRKVLL